MHLIRKKYSLVKKVQFEMLKLRSKRLQQSFFQSGLPPPQAPLPSDPRPRLPPRLLSWLSKLLSLPKYIPHTIWKLKQPSLCRDYTPSLSDFQRSIISAASSRTELSVSFSAAGSITEGSGPSHQRVLGWTELCIYLRCMCLQLRQHFSSWAEVFSERAPLLIR